MPNTEKRDKVAAMRKEYTREGLRREDIADDPMVQFDRWFEQATEGDLPEANACNLATSDPLGNPSSRIVLLKGYDERGFLFYTNYNSRKGTQLGENPNCALCFFWAPFERQVRIRGKAERLPRMESEQYFHSRPRESQLGAWASDQSSELENRKELEARYEEAKNLYQDNEEIPLPDFWGGYLIRPEAIEFWQGRPSRLHDRFLYTLSEDGEWAIKRLYP